MLSDCLNFSPKIRLDMLINVMLMKKNINSETIQMRRQPDLNLLNG